MKKLEISQLNTKIGQQTNIDISVGFYHKGKILYSTDQHTEYKKEDTNLKINSDLKKALNQLIIDFNISDWKEHMNNKPDTELAKEKNKYG